MLFLIILLFITYNSFFFEFKNNEKIADYVLVASSTATTVSSWDELKNAVDSGNYDVIKMRNSSSEDWVADSVIVITKNIQIEKDEDTDGNILIKRGTTDLLFDIKGGQFIFDGKDEGITIDGSYSTNTKQILYVSDKSNAKISQIIFKNNSTSINGGAITINGANLTLENCVISSNKANNGGGIFVTNSDSILTVDNTNVLANTSISGSGGGIYAYGKVSINNSNISNNTAYSYGGGIMIKSEAKVKNSKINSNTATEKNGGGIRSDGKTNITGGEIKNNKSASGGAGLDFSSGEAVYNNVVLESNLIGSDEVNVFPDIYSPNNIDWMNDDNLKIKKIDVELLKDFKYGDTGELAPYTGGTQGIVITDKYILLSQHTADNETSVIHVLDKKTLVRKNVILIDPLVYGYTFGHIGNMAYDNDTGYVYVLTNKKVNAVPQLAKFRVNNNGEIVDLSLLDSPQNSSLITYDGDHKQFIFQNSNKIWIYDNNFNLKKSFDAPSNLTRQGITYWKGHIYYACFEGGIPSKYQTIFNYNEKGSNLIYMYDLDGNLIKTLYISNKSIKGEIEGVAFQDNGEMIINYNAVGIKIYKSSFPIQVKELKLIKKPTKLTYLKNEEIDLSGIALSLILNDETEHKIISISNTSVTGFDSTKIGKQQITINYNGAKVFFEVEVLPDYGANKEIKENNKQKNNTVDNPKTGRMIAINLLLVGIFIGLYIAYISNKKRRLFKL